MKKILFFSLLLLICAAGWTSSNDLVVLLDTSESMLGEFNSTVSYLIRDILENNVSIDYTFHLLLFDSTTRKDMVQKIEKPDDAATIINHLALVQPFGEYTDLIEALSTLLAYGNELPADNEKNIVILTDGIHDPPPGKYSSSKEEQKREIDRLTDALSQEGWNINVVPLNSSDGTRPGDNLNADETEDYFTTSSDTSTDEKTDVEELSEKLDGDLVDPDSIEGQMVLTGGIHLENRKSVYKSKNQIIGLKFRADNYNSREIEITILDVLYQGRNILEQPVTFAVASEDSASFKLDLDFNGALTENLSTYPVKLSVMSSAPVAPLVYDLDIRFRAFSFTLDVLPFLIGALVLIALVIIIIGIQRTRSRIRSGVRDEKENDYSVLGLKKDNKKRTAAGEDRKYPYGQDDPKKVKGTVFYPESSSKQGKGKSPAPEQTVISGGSNKSKKAQSDSDLKSAQTSVLQTTANMADSKKNGQKSSAPSQNSAQRGAQRSAVQEAPEIPGYPKIKARSHTKNIKYLLMLNVNTPFNPIMAGTRVQRLDKDKELTIGSGNSSFYLYFSKMLPGAIASVRFNGNRCSFIPHDFKYFPDLKAPLEDCVNKKIKVVNGKEEQVITFKEWLSPLEEINRIMHLIDYRGMPKSPMDDSKFNMNSNS